MLPRAREAEFWQFLDRLVAGHRVVVDRPRGSRHPRYPDLVYPLDYGYLEGTSSIDGGGVDVWLGTAGSRDLDAVVLTVDLEKGDAEVKILLGCREEEKETILGFLQSGWMRAMLVRRA